MFLLTGSSEDALMALINQNNSLPVSVKPGDFYYGKIHALVGGAVKLPVVTMYNNREYEGYVDFTYRRYNLSKIFGGMRPIIRDVGQTSIHRMLPQINKHLGIDLQPRDIIDGDISWLGGNEQANFVFKATADSLGYEGEFVVQFIRVRPILSNVVVTKRLDVLTHPDSPTSGKRSLSMLTWGLDFTDHAKELALYYGTWSNYPGLKAMMADLGFANFPTAQNLTLEVLPTQNVPESNKAYSYVIVQKSVEGNDYKGAAYFHFNRT